MSMILDLIQKFVHRDEEMSQKKEVRKMRKLLGLLLVCSMLGSVAYGATSDTCTLTVTPTVNVSVNIVVTTYDYGTVTLGASTINSTAIQVTNDGDVNAKWQKEASATATGGATPWNLKATGAASPGTDEFKLLARVNATQEAESAFTEAATADGVQSAAYDDLTGAATCSAGSTYNLWIKLEMPASVAVSDAKTATFSIQATAL